MRFSFLLRPALIALVALAAPAAFSQTPDGETPAFETACDPLLGGATPGLFGLCVAYCEAKDCTDNPVVLAACQEANPGDPFGTHDCACGDILNNYNKRRGPGDPGMPCIMESGCPCFDAAFLAEEVSDPDQCVDTVGPPRTQTVASGNDSQGCNAVAQTIINFDDQGEPRSVICQAFDRDLDPDNGRCEVTLQTVQSISVAESESCSDLIRDSLACQP